jgi:hypothetical protein
LVEYWDPITRSALRHSLAVEIDDEQQLVPVRVFQREQHALPPKENTSSDYTLSWPLLRILSSNQQFS